MARHCRKCGTPLAETDRFCTECGAPVVSEPAAPQAPAQTPPPVAPPAPHRSPVGPIAFAVAAGAAALAAWLVLSQGEPPKPPVAASGPAVTQAPSVTPPVATPAASTPTASAPASSTPLVVAPPSTAAPTPPVASAPPTPPVQPPSTPASVAMPGTWEFFSNEDGTQLLFHPAGAGAEASTLFQMTCRGEDGMIAVRSSAVIDEAAEKLAGTAPPALGLVGGGQTMRADGYIVRAPEETALAFEAANTSALAKVLTAADLTITAPSLALRLATDVDRAAFRQFVEACPAPTGPAGAWASYTSLDSGFRVEVPRDLLRVGSADRFGRVWVARTGGGTVAIAGRVNALDEAFPAVVRKEVPPDLTTVAEMVGPDSLSIAGKAGGLEEHFIGRVTCGGANIATLIIAYPPAEQTTWAPLLGRIERSFLATTLPNGRPLCP